MNRYWICTSQAPTGLKVQIITTSACSPPTEFRAQQEGLLSQAADRLNCFQATFCHIFTIFWQVFTFRETYLFFFFFSGRFLCISSIVFVGSLFELHHSTTMIFEPAERVLLPTKDLLSYIFDDPPYDQDKPVSLNNGMLSYAKQGWFIHYLDLYWYSQSIAHNFLQRS